MLRLTIALPKKSTAQSSKGRGTPAPISGESFESVNEAGDVVLLRNMYGDGMAVVKDLGRSLDGFAPEAREALLLGVGFDTEQDAEAWLREH